MIESSGSMILPRGSLQSKAPLVLEMSRVYEAEGRLQDLAAILPGTAAEFMSVMNGAAHLTTNHIAAVTQEVILAKRECDRRKAVVVLEEMPKKFASMKESGMKPNEDSREAILALDEQYSNLKDRLDCLMAAGAHLENKVKTFIRAFNAAKSIMERRSVMAAGPESNFGDTVFEVSLPKAGHYTGE